MGLNISEKCVPGGTNFRGSKLNVTVQLVPLYVLSSNMAAISLASQTFSKQRRLLSVSCDNRVDKIRVDSTWQQVHMQTRCMWDQDSEVDLLVHTKSCQSCACHRAA